MDRWYCQTTKIEHTLVGDTIVDHSDVIGASSVGAALATSSFSTWTPAFNELGSKENCKTRREAFKLCDLLRLILEILR